MSSDEIKIKKITPYPILLNLNYSNNAATQSIEGKIVKLTQTGCLIETEKPLKVGENFESKFILPASNFEIPFKATVVKTYDMFRGQMGDPGHNYKLAEFLFKSIGPKSQDAIGEFIIKIGQVK